MLPVSGPPNSPEAPSPGGLEPHENVFTVSDLSVWYGDQPAITEINMEVPEGQVTAIIGPSGCGKSSLLRVFNRMNDLIPGAAVAGKVAYRHADIYGPDVDPTQVRTHIGMVFQKSNPFPKSIFDNIAYGPRLHDPTLGKRRRSADLENIVEESLVQAALWEEVKNRLKTSALSLSGGQQQRLCIARALAVRPDILLMDEPCSALDPPSTFKIEDLMTRLIHEKVVNGIVIVTHNMQQAARVSDQTAFLYVHVDDAGESKGGVLVESGSTTDIFERPQDPRTADYIEGRVG